MARATGNVFQGRPGFPFAEVPAGTLAANLHDVTGTLELFPDERLGIASGQLLIDLYFQAEHTEGNMRPRLLLEMGEYWPLSGSWPEPLPPALPGYASPDL